MKKHESFLNSVFIILLSFSLVYIESNAQNVRNNPELDKKVKAFLYGDKGGAHYLNVPDSDGELLFDIIVKNGYTRAVEIGTSTGISSVWIAWALSKTGGKLITIEIDENRHSTALRNFEKAGLSDYIDARLGDAHKIVPELKGTFDFVFSDADKDWYKNYFLAMDPKLTVNGCYTSHNVTENTRNSWQTEYLNFLKKQTNYHTTVNNNGAGMAISYKKAEK